MINQLVNERLNMSMGNRMNKINAPMFIYTILYKRNPPRSIGGNECNHQTQNINGISIDKHIPANVIKELMRIPDIESRASCEGSNHEHPTFFIFRLKEEDRHRVKKIVRNLNRHDDVVAGYDLGNGGQYRIGVTTEMWYDKDPDLFHQWWKELPDKIRNSL